MFLVAVKTALVEALRDTFTSQFPDLAPQSVTIEYPEEEEQWPAVLVQFRPAGTVGWTGLNPDEYQAIQHLNAPNTYNTFRRGDFSGSVDLSILALHSEERDRIWDALVQLILMGDERDGTTAFYDTIENHDLINMTVQKTEITPIGDTIGPGTPWDSEVLTYEATLRFNLIGQFIVNIYTQELLSITEIQVLEPYRADQTPPGTDNRGPWHSVTQIPGL